MKKNLIKEILEIDKLLKFEIKKKEKTNNEFQKLNTEINKIEQKINNKNITNKLSNLSSLFKLYSIALKKNNRKIFIENNLSEFKKQNEKKEIELEKYLKKIEQKSKKNEEIITKKKEELDKIYEKTKINKKIFEDNEQIIISPDMMSIHLESKTNQEIEFMNKIKLITKKAKINNYKILKQIDSYLKTLTIMQSKKDSMSNAELSTGIKNSSKNSKKNIIIQQLEVLNNINMNNFNEENDSTSSISMELETNLNLDELPSDDESLRFIDKVFDIKSNIKPIKNRIKSIMTDPFSPIKEEKNKKVEPIKIEKPIDYKSKGDDIAKYIEQIKNKINNKKIKIEEIKNKRINIEEKVHKIQQQLKKEIVKIKVIKEEIDFIKKQIDDLLANNKRVQYLRIFSINNIINNRNYYIFDHNDNNSIYDKETFRK